MGWVRTFLILTLASTLTDIVAWHQVVIPVVGYTIPFWLILRLGLGGISLYWVFRVRCWVAPSIRQKIQDLARDAAYDEIYDIAQRAARH